MTIEEIANKFEEMINNGTMSFPEPGSHDISQLPSLWTKMVVDNFLNRHGVSWAIGNKSVGNAICIKTDDPYLQYLDIFDDTGEFMWCTDGHSKGVHPDHASIYLINTYMLRRDN